MNSLLILLQLVPAEKQLRSYLGFMFARQDLASRNKRWPGTVALSATAHRAKLDDNEIVDHTQHVAPFHLDFNSGVTHVHPFMASLDGTRDVHLNFNQYLTIHYSLCVDGTRDVNQSIVVSPFVL